MKLITDEEMDKYLNANGWSISSFTSIDLNRRAQLAADQKYMRERLRQEADKLLELLKVLCITCPAQDGYPCSMKTRCCEADFIGAMESHIASLRKEAEGG